MLQLVRVNVVFIVYDGWKGSMKKTQAQEWFYPIPLPRSAQGTSWWCQQAICGLWQQDSSYFRWNCPTYRLVFGTSSMSRAAPGQQVVGVGFDCKVFGQLGTFVYGHPQNGKLWRKVWETLGLPWAYMPPEGRLHKGTNRTQQSAEQMAAAWSWRWFSALSSADQSCFEESGSVAGDTASKRRRVT